MATIGSKTPLRISGMAYLTGLLLLACDGADPPGDVQTRTLHFQATAHGKALHCADPPRPLGSDQQLASLADLRFYVHDFAVIDAAGTLYPAQLQAEAGWVLGNLALIDLEDGSGACSNGSAAQHRSVQLGWDGPAAVRGVQFRLGVPENLNHADVLAAKAPLNLSGLYWSWLGGYKHLRLDLATAPAAGWKLHLGATGCDQTPKGTLCSHPNQSLIRLEQFDFGTQAATLDLGKLLAQSPLGAEHGGCMADLDDPLCAPLLHALGLPAAATEAAGPAQSAFGAAPRQGP